MLVQPDGAIDTSSRVIRSLVEAAGASQSIRFDFGLPTPPPKESGWLDPRLPVCRICWESGGIRYTQTVLLTRLEPAASLDPSGGPAADSVLLVQVTGENLGSYYTDASAAFAVVVGGRTVALELREGLVYALLGPQRALIAAVDIPAAGVSDAAGQRLQFKGHMPPAASGAMIVKIPAAPLEGEGALNRLRDLDFAEELHRVRRFWTEKAQALGTNQFPLRFAGPGQ
jgi:hypothetical protein